MEMPHAAQLLTVAAGRTCIAGLRLTGLTTGQFGLIAKFRCAYKRPTFHRVHLEGLPGPMSFREICIKGAPERII